MPNVQNVCKACLARGKTWNGSDPKCGFLDGGQLNADNWNCATVGKIRELAERQGDYRIRYTREENQQYATISTMETEVLPERNSEGFMAAQPVCLWVGWYKSRGTTEGMWLMFENLPPRAPTEEECLKIIEHYA